MKESPYPYACLLMGSLIAIVSVTAATSLELQFAGLGFGGSVLASGSTAFKNKDGDSVADTSLIVNEVVAQLIAQGLLPPTENGG